jgi:hypothetical protein
MVLDRILNSARCAILGLDRMLRFGTDREALAYFCIWIDSRLITGRPPSKHQ